jgi:hypothetical protein
MPTHIISANGSEPDPNTGDVQIPIYSKKTILTDAQIKALQTTYIELVPAPGEGKLNVLHSAFWVIDTTAGVYTNQHVDSAVFIGYGDWDLELTTLGALPSLAGQFISKVAPLIMPIVGGTWDGYSYDFLSNKPADYALNKALKLIASNATNGDYTGGNPANSLSVTVFYSIVDL